MGSRTVYMQVSPDDLEMIDQHIDGLNYCRTALQNWFISSLGQNKRIKHDEICKDHWKLITSGDPYCKECHVICEVSNRLIFHYASRLQEVSDYMSRHDDTYCEFHPNKVMFEGTGSIGMFSFVSQDYVGYFAENFLHDISLEEFNAGFQLNLNTKYSSIVQEIYKLPRNNRIKLEEISTKDFESYYDIFQRLVDFYKSAYKNDSCVLIGRFSSVTSSFDSSDTHFDE
jgi:hypothetical protein